MAQLGESSTWAACTNIELPMTMKLVRLEVCRAVDTCHVVEVVKP